MVLILIPVTSTPRVVAGPRQTCEPLPVSAGTNKHLITCGSLRRFLHKPLGRRASYYPDNPSKPPSAQRPPLFAEKFRFAVKRRCHRTGGTESLSTFHAIIISAFPRQPSHLYALAHQGCFHGGKCASTSEQKQMMAPFSESLWRGIKD